MNILTLWPIIKWALQALGFMGPEDKEAERNFQIKLMQAQEENRKALTEAFQSFQGLWRPPAERVYVWANTAIALFQPAIIGLVYYDVIFGDRRSIKVAVDLQAAGISGLFIMSILLFPLYGPALVSGVSQVFGSAVDLAVRKKNGAVQPSAPPASRASPERPGIATAQPGPAVPESSEAGELPDDLDVASELRGRRDD